MPPLREDRTRSRLSENREHEGRPIRMDDSTFCSLGHKVFVLCFLVIHRDCSLWTIYSNRHRVIAINIEKGRVRPKEMAQMTEI